MSGRVIEQERHEFQDQFVQAAKTHRYSAFFGGLQSGKSVAGADALYELLYGDKPLRLPRQTSGRITPEVWILSKSYALAEQAWSYFQWRAEDCIYTAADCKRKGLSRQDRVEWLKPGADGTPIKLRVRTAKDPEQLRATGALLAAWGDEIAHWPELAWLNLQGRGVVTPTRYLLTTTPKGKNWLYRDVYTAALQGEKDYSVTTCRSVDNPWADAQYIEKLRKKFGPEYAAQELDALFTAAVGYVYAEFDRLTHMKAPPSKDPSFYQGTYAGVDPGTSDPYAVGIWGRTWEGDWWLLEEFYRTGGTSTQWAPKFLEMQARWKCKRWYVDKRRPSDVKDLRAAGLPVMANIDIHDEVTRETIKPMISVVLGLLRAGRLHIAPECEWHAEEFEKYAYRDVDDSNPKNRGEVPIDYMNHAMDEMRYAICSVEELFGDRRPRYRTGADRVARPVGPDPRRRPQPQKIPTVSDMIRAQDRKRDAQEQAARQPALRWRARRRPDVN